MHHRGRGEKVLGLTLPIRKVFGELLGEARSEYKTFQGSSVYLSRVLRPLFKDTIPQNNRFDAVFDRFEYLSALARADLYEKTKNEKGLWNFPLQPGWFVVRNWSSPEDILNIVEQEVQKMGNAWPPLQAGLFDGKVGRLNDIRLGLRRRIMERRKQLA